MSYRSTILPSTGFEAFHTREHEEYNRALMKLGYDVEKMEEPIRKGFEIVKNPLHRLAITCAIEHMTAAAPSGTAGQGCSLLPPAVDVARAGRAGA